MSARFTTRFAPLVLAGALIATSCTDSGGDDGLAGPSGSVADLSSEEIVLTSGLQTVADCSTLLDRIKDEAVERVGPYGFDGGLFGIEPEIAFGVDEEARDVEESAAETTAAPANTVPAATTSADQAAVPEARAGGLDAASEDAASDGVGGVEGESFSGTNNQEQAVDEADIVKTDGRNLVIVSGNTLRVIDVTAATPRLTTTVRLPEEVWGGQMFLDDDRVLLMTSGWTDRPFLDRSIPADWYPGASTARLLEIDLDSGDIVRSLEFEGAYLSAREIDGTVRVVLTASAGRFPFVYPSNRGAEDSAEAANKALIEDSTIEQWLPTYRLSSGGETVSQGPVVDCDRVHLPAEFAGFGSIVLLTVDLEEGLGIDDAVSVFTDAQIMYASTDRVAVATPRWPTFDDEGRPVDGNEYHTAIHTFDITDPERADYVASGLVDGTLLNQFSLSEHEGHLRVATTAGTPWGSESSESFVTVLRERGDVLEIVGQVGNLGRGERIFAVRFMGDRAFVVTFRQVDPLYTLDLSVPSDPRVLGELKIPGFSDYLHPVGDDHLLGVGMDADDDGRVLGAQVSLFDVSDMTDPLRTAQLGLGPGGGDGGDNDVNQSSSSPVSWDAKAFTFWDGVAVIPVDWWRYDPRGGGEANGSDAVLVEVDVDGRLTEIGRVSHPETEECETWYVEPREDGPIEEPPAATEPPTGDAEADFVDRDVAPAPGQAPPIEEERYCYSWSPSIQRSIVIGDDLYTVSDGGVQVNDFDGLDPVTWIPFERR